MRGVAAKTAVLEQQGCGHRSNRNQAGACTIADAATAAANAANATCPCRCCQCLLLLMLLLLAMPMPLLLAAATATAANVARCRKNAACLRGCAACAHV